MERVSRFSPGIDAAIGRLAKKAVFAYCANVDSVHRISLLEALGLSNVLPGLYDCARSGSGSEIVIDRMGFDSAQKMLGKGRLRCGGQAGNMANDAAGLGVIGHMHTPSYSKELLSLFKSRKVLVAHKSGFSPAVDCGDSSEPPVHLILEYEKGGGIPSSNRFIASFDELNTELLVHPLFSKNILREIGGIDRAFIAGFHLAGEGAYRNGIFTILEQLGEWKTLNPRIKIHLEMGQFSSKEVLRRTAADVFPEASSVGFNENEIAGVLEAVSEKPSAGINGIAKVAKLVPTVLFHTRNYSLAFSREFPAKTLADSLAFASSASALKASTGKPPSIKGLRNGKFNPKKAEPPKLNKKLFEKEGIAVAFCPSAEIIPKTTVGLGDCFSMAFFLSLR